MGSEDGLRAAAINAETLRKWLRQAEVDNGEAFGYRRDVRQSTGDR